MLRKKIKLGMGIGLSEDLKKGREGAADGVPDTGDRRCKGSEAEHS